MFPINKSTLRYLKAICGYEEGITNILKKDYSYDWSAEAKKIKFLKRQIHNTKKAMGPGRRKFVEDLND